MVGTNHALSIGPTNLKFDHSELGSGGKYDIPEILIDSQQGVICEGKRGREEPVGFNKAAGWIFVKSRTNLGIKEVQIRSKNEARNVTLFLTQNPVKSRTT